MPAVYVSRISQWIEKHFNAKGGNVITDIDPTAIVELPFAIGVEDRYLQGWNRFGIAAPQAGVAAQLSRARIRNPVGSNVIIVLEMVTSITAPTDQPSAQFGAVTVDLTTLVSTNFSRIDPRGNPNPTAIVSTQTQVAFGTSNVSKLGQVAEFIQGVNQEFPILPGNGFDVTTSIVNTALTCSFVWRERALELSELT